MKHFRAYHNAGAMVLVNINISRLQKMAGDWSLEQRIMEHYKQKKERGRVRHTSSFEFVELGGARRRAPSSAI